MVAKALPLADFDRPIHVGATCRLQHKLSGEVRTFEQWCTCVIGLGSRAAAQACVEEYVRSGLLAPVFL